MITPGLGAAAAEEVAAVYRDAELRILRRIAYSLRQGLDSDGYDELQLGRLQMIRAEVVAELAKTYPDLAASITFQLESAYATGVHSSLADAGQTIDALGGMTIEQSAAVVSLARDTTEAIDSAMPSMLRAVDDIYRSAVVESSQAVLTGSLGRRDAVQDVLNKLAGQGIRSIPTKRGTMDLPTYVTMAVRTAVNRSVIAGHTDSMDALGLDLVVIHPGPRACDICDRWARSILRRNAGPVGRLEFADIRTGGRVVVVVDATLDEARAAGWGHPNCRCGMGSYLPGVTDTSVIERPAWDAVAYKAQQQQRGIERQIIAWKRRDALALDPASAQEARVKVLAWQQAQRDLLDAHPYLKRQYKREQLSSNGVLPRGNRPL